MSLNQFSPSHVLKQAVYQHSLNSNFAYFFSNGSVGDRAIFYSYLQGFHRTTSVQPVIIDRVQKKEFLADLFPSLKNSVLTIPDDFIANINETCLPWMIGDSTPGKGHIFFPGFGGYLDGTLVNAWFRKNDREHNYISLTKLILGIPSSTLPEYLKLPEPANSSPLFESIAGRKTIILAPHSTSVTKLLPQEFWISLALILQQNNYHCIVNLAKNFLQQINPGNELSADTFGNNGVEVFEGTFTELLHISTQVDHVFTIRSGYADLLNLLPLARYTVLYPPCLSHVTNYYSLSNGFGVAPRAEILINESESLLDVYNRLLGSLD
jgi:hypothetical protein